MPVQLHLGNPDGSVQSGPVHSTNPLNEVFVVHCMDGRSGAEWVIAMELPKTTKFMPAIPHGPPFTGWNVLMYKRI